MSALLTRKCAASASNRKTTMKKSKASSTQPRMPEVTASCHPRVREERLGVAGMEGTRRSFWLTIYIGGGTYDFRVSRNGSLLRLREMLRRTIYAGAPEIFRS